MDDLLDFGVAPEGVKEAQEGQAAVAPLAEGEKYVTLPVDNLSRLSYAWDIETVPFSEERLNEIMPNEVRDPRMPADLERPNIPDFDNLTNGALKDPEKIAAWREKKRDEWHVEHKGKITKWNSDCAAKRQKWMDEATLRATCCEIRMIALVSNDEVIAYTSEQVGYTELDLGEYSPFAEKAQIRAFYSEEAMLREYWAFVRKASRDGAVFHGWFTSGYDIPMTIRRSWLNKVRIDVPVMQGRFANRTQWRDLMEVWQCGDNRESFSMNNACKAFGLPPKDGVGSQFHIMWREDTKKAIAYGCGDSIRTRELSKLMQQW